MADGSKVRYERDAGRRLYRPLARPAGSESDRTPPGTTESVSSPVTVVAPSPPERRPGFPGTPATRPELNEGLGPWPLI
jgi:hypothetical protein